MKKSIIVYCLLIFQIGCKNPIVNKVEVKEQKNNKNQYLNQNECFNNMEKFKPTKKFVNVINSNYQNKVDSSLYLLTCNSDGFMNLHGKDKNNYFFWDEIIIDTIGLKEKLHYKHN